MLTPHAWLKQTITWRNKVVARPADDLVRVVLSDSVRWAMEGAGSIECWGAAVLHTVKAIRPTLVHCVSEVQAIPASEICDGLHDLWQASTWGDSVPSSTPSSQHRACEGSKGFKLATYRHWFCRGKPSDGEPAPCPVPRRQGFIYHVQRPNQIRALACFRLSGHELNIEQQRHANIPRLQRACKCCAANVVEDEMHVFECPAYHHIRQSFQDVLGAFKYPLSDADMYSIMNPCKGDKWRRLGTFLLKVMEHRAHVLHA